MFDDLTITYQSIIIPGVVIVVIWVFYQIITAIVHQKQYKDIIQRFESIHKHLTHVEHALHKTSPNDTHMNAKNTEK